MRVTVFLPGIQDPVARRETILWIRAEFERNRHLTDLVAFIWLGSLQIIQALVQALIEDKIKMGRREIRQVLPTNARP
jgi:hypothetical protein